MLIHPSLLLWMLVRVIVGPGWSEPVITIEVPGSGYQRKALVETDGNHIHQMWGRYEDAPRIGYNVVLPDGSVLVPDTLFSRDVWSAYLSATHAPGGGMIGFWRESTPKWYSVKDGDGNTVVPATYYSGEGYSWWPTIDASLDSLGRVHMVWDSGPLICYSVMEPGVGELWRDTIPDSKHQSLVVVDGDRVHIKFNGPDQLADYIQYDLEGNVTIPTVDIVEESVDPSNWCSMAADHEGNAFIFVYQSIQGYGRRLYLHKVDGLTGEKLIDGLLIYQVPSGKAALCLQILPTASGEAFYLLWTEIDPWGSYPRWIRFAVIDTEGEFLLEPCTAYDYTDEEIQEIRYLEADTNADGDLFVHWSAWFQEELAYYVVLGWFDHTELSVEGSSHAAVPSEPAGFLASENPFDDQVWISPSGGGSPSTLRVYDIAGRLVRTLQPSSEGRFLWDGRSSSGTVLPSGVYIVRAEGFEALRLVRRRS